MITIFFARTRLRPVPIVQVIPRSAGNDRHFELRYGFPIASHQWFQYQSFPFLSFVDQAREDGAIDIS